MCKLIYHFDRDGKVVQPQPEQVLFPQPLPHALVCLHEFLELLNQEMTCPPNSTSSRRDS